MDKTPATFTARTITVELTHRCHRRCAFCYIPDLGRVDSIAPDELSADALALAAGKLVQATGCKQLQLSGGEPLLRRDLLEVIDALKSTGASVSIITDGAQLDEPMARELAERKVGPVQPTLLAGSAALHDSLRGAGGFLATTRAVAAASAAGIPVVVCMVITRANWAEAGRVAELAFALGARSLALSRLCPAAGAGRAHDALMPSAMQVREAAQSAATVCRSLGLSLAAAVAIPPCVWQDPSRPPLRVGVCALAGPGTAITVGPDGSIRSCALSTVHAGNIVRESWEAIARKLWAIQLGPLRALVPEPCAACAWVSRCHGGCRMSAETVFGSASHPDPLAPCASTKK